MFKQKVSINKKQVSEGKRKEIRTESEMKRNLGEGSTEANLYNYVRQLEKRIEILEKQLQGGR